LAGEIIVSSIFAPKLLYEFEILKRNAIQAASDTTDAYIQNWTRWVIGWGETQRGRINNARDSARELLQVGRLLNDPRSTGFGLNLLSFIALFSDSYAEVLEYSEQSLSVAVTPWDRAAATLAKGSALMLLRRPDEAAKLLQEQRRRITADGDFFSLLATDPMLGLYKVLQGNFAEGMHIIEELILRVEKEGYQGAAEWLRLNLAQVYLEIIAGNERPRFTVLLKNLPILIKVMATASSRIGALMTHVLNYPHYDPRVSNWQIGNDPRPAVQDQEKASPCGSASDQGKADTLAIRTNPSTRAGRNVARGIGTIVRAKLADHNQ
jgi:tetratricopeptide (TPR) repeat protein